jgi:hypothetical protein
MCQVVDNSRDAHSGKIVTSGISTLSGTYYDVNSREMQVDDAKTPWKTKQRASKFAQTNALTLLDTDSPLSGLTGWSWVPSIPERSGGEFGIPYIDSADAYPRTVYYNDLLKQQCAEFVVAGHHIWSESEGLGVDSIYIAAKNKSGTQHHLSGNWIVDGFVQNINRVGHEDNQTQWTTTLKCHRIHHNATARETGMITAADSPI